MPMNWSAEADAKLLCAIMQLPSVTISGQDKETLAKIMGCTPKALTHRIAHFRSLAKANGIATDNAGDEEGKTAKTTGRKKSAAGKRKKADEGDGDDDEQETGAEKKAKVEVKEEGDVSD